MKYYVYAYLDPRKPGTFVYRDLTLDYEPFYIGKGSGNRAYNHLDAVKFKKKVRDKNKHKIGKISKILEEGLDPIIVFLNRFNSAAEALEGEISKIKLIGRSDLNKGPLTNLTDGGDGARNIPKDRIVGFKPGRIPWNKGKMNCYNSIVNKRKADKLRGRKRGPLSEKQKQQVSQTHKGKIVSDETRRKQSESQKKRIRRHITWPYRPAWNKGKYIPRKTYKFINNGQVLIINDLMTYCKDHNLCTSNMRLLYNGKYACKKYKGYEPIYI